MKIKLETSMQIEGDKHYWVVTSPDMPGLYLVNQDLEYLIKGMPEAIKRLRTLQSAENKDQKS